VWAQHYIGAALLFQGDPEAALAEFQEEADLGFRAKGATLALRALGRRAEYEQSFARYRDEWGAEWPSEIAQIYALDGDPDRAFEWLDRAVAQNEAELWQQVSQEFYRPLHDDPRWLPLLRRIGVAPEQLDAIEFKVDFPQNRGHLGG
jgi:tetratricopeptide (TPR) repeat protein